MDTIDIDLPCARCGYNLRTLPSGGVCPECAASVATSREAFDTRPIPLYRLRQRGVGWLIDVRRAATLAVLCNAAAFAIGVLYGSPRPPYATSTSWVFATVWLAPLVAVFVTSCWAAWRLALTSGPIARKVARSALFCTLLGLCLIFLNSRWLHFYVDLNWWTADRIDANYLRIARFIGMLFFSVAWPTAIACTTLYTARLFWLARQWLVAIGLGLAGAIVAAILGLSLLSTFPHSDGIERAGSGEIMPILLGPTGTLPVLGTFVYELRFRRPSDLIGLGFDAAVLALVAWPVYLRRTFTRAIALGELPAANSRS